MEPRLKLHNRHLLEISALSDFKPSREALLRILDSCRAASARDNVEQRFGLDVGFRLEDAESVTLHGTGVAEGLVQWVARRLPNVEVRHEEGLKFGLEMKLSRRHGASPTKEHYVQDEDGRVHVEAFEIHVVEHCNLRCGNCCNMSPLVPERTPSLSEIAQSCKQVTKSLRSDVIKIMGGEPLLHPQIDEITPLLKASGISARVRLFTNGLLLKSMRERFWRSLDEMTISNYESARVPQSTLDLAREKSLHYDFVLNIKPVAKFSRVLSAKYREATQDTFDSCWLRHRCLIARNGRFYMCTKAAYAKDFDERVAREEPPTGFELVESQDSVALGDADLASKIAEYMNRTKPLAACHYCLGGSGPQVMHHQLSKTDVAAGRLEVIQ